MNGKPNKWIAAALGLFFQPMGLLYVARPHWAAIYAILFIAFGVAKVAFLANGAATIVINVLMLGFAVTAAAHSYVLASSPGASTTRPVYAQWYSLAGVLLSVFALTFLVRAFVIEPFKVPASSMAPTVPVGSYLLVDKWGYGHYNTYGITLSRTLRTAALARGDLLVFEYPDRRELSFVKRIIGLPGDKVTYRDKRLSINGESVRTSAVESTPKSKDRGKRIREFSEGLGASSYVAMIDDIAPPIRLGGVRDFAGREKCVYDESGVECVVPAGNYFVMGDNRDNSEDSRYWGFVPESAIIGKVSRVFLPGT